MPNVPRTTLKGEYVRTCHRIATENTVEIHIVMTGCARGELDECTDGAKGDGGCVGDGGAKTGNNGALISSGREGGGRLISRVDADVCMSHTSTQANQVPSRLMRRNPQVQSSHEIYTLMCDHFSVGCCVVHNVGNMSCGNVGGNAKGTWGDGAGRLAKTRNARKMFIQNLLPIRFFFLKRLRSSIVRIATQSLHSTSCLYWRYHCPIAEMGLRRACTLS